MPQVMKGDKDKRKVGMNVKVQHKGSFWERECSVSGLDNDSILVVIFYYTSERCYQEGKVDKGYRGLSVLFSYNYMSLQLWKV